MRTIQHATTKYVCGVRCVRTWVKTCTTVRQHHGTVRLSHAPWTSTLTCATYISVQYKVTCLRSFNKWLEHKQQKWHPSMYNNSNS